jgi:hypothetical protein
LFNKSSVPELLIKDQHHHVLLTLLLACNLAKPSYKLVLGEAKQ